MTHKFSNLESISWLIGSLNPGFKQDSSALSFFWQAGTLYSLVSQRGRFSTKQTFPNKLAETNCKSPWNVGRHLKGKDRFFQPSIFRGYISFREYKQCLLGVKESIMFMVHQLPMLWMVTPPLVGNPLQYAYKSIQRWVDDHPGSPTHMQIMGRLDPQRKNYIHRNDNLGLLTQQNQRKNRQIFDRSKISVLAPIPFMEKSPEHLWKSNRSWLINDPAVKLPWYLIHASGFWSSPFLMILNLIPAKLPDGCHDFLLIKFALTRPFSSRFKIFRALVSSGGVGLVLPFFFRRLIPIGSM